MIVKYNSVISIFIMVTLFIYILPRIQDGLSPLVWLGIMAQIFVAAFFYKRPYFEISESKVSLLGLFGRFTYGDKLGESIFIQDECIYLKKNDGTKKKIPVFQFISNKRDWATMKLKRAE